MLVYYFVPFIVSNRYLLFSVSSGHNSVTVQNRTHVCMNFFDHKYLGNHLLQLCPKVVKHSVLFPNLVSEYATRTVICKPRKTVFSLVLDMYSTRCHLRLASELCRFIILQVCFPAGHSVTAAIHRDAIRGTPVVLRCVVQRCSG